MVGIVELILTQIAGFGAGVLLTSAILLLLYFTQDRARGVGRLVARAFDAVRSPVLAARRWLFKVRTERKFNGLISAGAKDRPFLSASLRIKWENPHLTREAFFERKRFVVVLPRSFDRDEVLLETMYLFVSRSMLVDIKRFLSSNQREAVNLYFTARMLEASSLRLSHQFATEFVPANLSDRIAEYLSVFALLERFALFEDVAVRELAHVGTKVAPLGRADAVSAEVDALLDLLRSITERQPSEELDLVLERMYVRCAIVLVGRSEKINQGIDPYVKYIDEALRPRQIDSIYILTDAGKEKAVSKLVDAITPEYSAVKTTTRRAMLLGRAQDIRLVSLRARDASVLSPAAVTGRASLLSGSDSRSPADAIEPRSPDGNVLGRILWLHADGYGFISLDDPAFHGTDARFFLSAVMGRSAVVGSGDRVSMRVTRDERGRYAATNIRVLKSASERKTPTRPQNTETTSTEPTPAPVEAKTVALINLTDVAVATVQILQEQAGANDKSEVNFADLGVNLRMSIPGFSHQTLGHSNLISLMNQVAQVDPRISVGRYPNGHPYIVLSD